ncbi:YdaU family protein [Kordiimonas sp.]|uniref:YdaU family protein n=1 Tax=Kordiimonas sp. TaxID=1970157 RepID=UPI003A952594
MTGPFSPLVSRRILRVAPGAATSVAQRVAYLWRMIFPAWWREVYMAEFPALPLFTDAYLADTRHLTAEEHGAYLLLLMCAWRTRGCALKDCDRTLARTVGVTRARWRKLRPVLTEFFTVEAGLWQQKKLSEVYRGVEERVAKNRQNGAKGGRAKARKVSRMVDEAGDGGSQKLPTKSQNQTPKPNGEAGVIAAAAGLDGDGLSVKAMAPVAEWLAAGAVVEEDILPTIAALRARQETRAGRRPTTLAYYTPAVLEARDARLGAVQKGSAHAQDSPPPPPKRKFDPESVDDWRLFLGDANSRFRGDYLSQNWAIGRGHPVFEASSLGPDPRHSVNKKIPPEIMAEYGPKWRWRS